MKLVRNVLTYDQIVEEKTKNELRKSDLLLLKKSFKIETISIKHIMAAYRQHISKKLLIDAIIATTVE